jgi:hypothetical protein
MRTLLTATLLALLTNLSCAKGGSDGAATQRQGATGDKAGPQPPLRLPTLEGNVDKKDPSALEVFTQTTRETAHLKLGDELGTELPLSGTPGSTVTVEGQSTVLDARGKGRLVVPLLPPLLQGLQHWSGKGNDKDVVTVPNLRLEVGVKLGAQELQDGYRPLALTLVSRWLKQTVVAGKPARLPGEGEARSGKKLWLLAYLDAQRVFLQDRPGALRDTDLVVVSEYGSSRKVNCGWYSNQQVDSAKVVGITLRGVKLTVYERRTGKRLGTKELPGEGKCPRVAVSTEVVYGPSDKTMKRFVQQFL